MSSVFKDKIRHKILKELLRCEALFNGKERTEEEKILYRRELSSEIKDTTEFVMRFSKKAEYHCVSIVDIVNSTHIISKLSLEKSCLYYSIFLNAMALVSREFGGSVVKNGGDSLLMYFPNTVNDKDRNAFREVLECGLTMIEAREIINFKASEEMLPDINFRISADYGQVMMADSTTSIKDIFGPSVNICSRINSFAIPNGMVIGGDLYQCVKKERDFVFKEIRSCDLGHKYHYSVYSIKRKIPLKFPL